VPGTGRAQPEDTSHTRMIARRVTASGILYVRD
jgi:hypothetical protein